MHRVRISTIRAEVQLTRPHAKNTEGSSGLAADRCVLLPWCHGPCDPKMIGRSSIHDRLA